MNSRKLACIIYVAATEGQVPQVKAQLELEGYEACTVRCTLEIAKNAQNGNESIPRNIEDCITRSDLVMFLIPEDEAQDEGIGLAGSMATAIGKRIIGLISGDRSVYPDELRTADSIIPITSKRIAAVIQGENVWETTSCEPIPDRRIDHQKCQ